MHFKKLKRVLNQISKIVSFPLRIVDLVAHVQVLGFEKVHDWQNLSVVWHKSLSNGVRAGDQGLHNLESNCDDFWVTGVQSGLDGDNELGDNWQHFCTTLIQHVKHSLYSQESVWVDFFTDSFEENGEVVMII
jgi:hypothetical protein